MKERGSPNRALVPADIRFLVVGLIRNAEKTIVADMRRLDEVFRSFASVQYLVVESDSDDGTKEQLALLTREIPGFRSLSLGSLRERLPKRTARISFCRNRYLHELLTNPLYSEVGYVAVVDLDGMNGLLTTDGVLSCWERDDWGVCAANQQGPYYDVWPLRHPFWSPNDCWLHYQFLVDAGVSVKKAKEAAIYSRMVTLDPLRDWIEVESAFGGLAIYRREVLEGVLYEGLDGQGREICEHVSLNAAILKAGYRIFINPRLINTGYTRHTRRFKKPPGISHIMALWSAVVNHPGFHPSVRRNRS